MTVEEFETIRMIDLEGLTKSSAESEWQQDPCPALIRNSQKEVADSLVNGRS